MITESAGAVIGPNFGLSYSSIASINPHGRVDMIANEDGERQLATPIAFKEDQVYIGNQATLQFVRNAPNVIDSPRAAALQNGSALRWYIDEVRVPLPSSTLLRRSSPRRTSVVHWARPNSRTTLVLMRSSRCTS